MAFWHKITVNKQKVGFGIWCNNTKYLCLEILEMLGAVKNENHSAT